MKRREFIGAIGGVATGTAAVVPLARAEDRGTSPASELAIWKAAVLFLSRPAALLAGEVLEVRIVDPALAHAFVR